MTNDNVQAIIAELRKPQTDAVLLSKEQQRVICREIAINPKGSPMARLRAIEVDAKLAGFFAPDQVVVDTGPNELASIEERAKHCARVLSIATAPHQHQSNPANDC